MLLRTPPWILPRQDHAVPTWRRLMYRFLPITQRIVRTQIYWRMELVALGLVYRTHPQDFLMKVARQHLENQVKDPYLRKKLTPQYMMGCKCILLSDDFYPALTRANVEVITATISEIRANSILTEDGKEREIDTIICATGFHVTNAQLPHAVHGRGGLSLAARWQDGLSAYFGTTVSGFPNLFLLIC